MFILDSLLIGGLRFVLDKVAAAAEAEMNDDTALRDQLLEAQMRLEVGEITEDQFEEIERNLLAAIREIKRSQGALTVSSKDTITGVDIESFNDNQSGKRKVKREKLRLRNFLTFPFNFSLLTFLFNFVGLLCRQGRRRQDHVRDRLRVVAAASRARAARVHRSGALARRRPRSAAVGVAAPGLAHRRCGRAERSPCLRALVGETSPSAR